MADITAREPHQAINIQQRENEDALPEGMHPLDSPGAKEHLKKLKQWWHEARTAQSDNRAEMAKDADFYDGLQWEDEDIVELAKRGQAPLVFNRTKQFIDWILGTERRTRIESRVYPRGNADHEAAESKTKLIKYLNDVNKGRIARSRAFADSVKVGVGWLEDGIRSDPTDELLFSRYESWRNMWYDPLGLELDTSDWRYLFRAKWLDLDVGINMFPDREQAIRSAAVSHNMFVDEEMDELSFQSSFHFLTGQNTITRSGSAAFDDAFHVGERRQRVQFVECWYRVPTRVKVLRTTADADLPPEHLDSVMGLNGVDRDDQDPFQNLLVERGYASVFDAIKMKVWVAIFVRNALLQNMASPYTHNRFPFTPVWGYRRDRDNAPYGQIRNMRSPQEDLNKRRAKALWILSTNSIIADENAFEDWDEVAEEIARPDFVLKKRQGTEVEVNRDTGLAREHVNLMGQDEAFLEITAGVTEENVGEATNAISGRAILARQTQGSVTTAALYDNQRYATQLQGEMQLSLVEQYYTAPKAIRITDDKKAAFHQINTPQRMPNGAVAVLNDITKSAADFIVDAQDFRESVRLAMFEQLMEMMQNLPPEVSIELLDLVFEMSDLPEKDELVRRMRRINKQVDPDAPDAEQQIAEQEDAEAEQSDQDRRAIESEIFQKEARGEQAEGQAANMRADVITKAFELAAQLQAFPALAPAVDSLFRSLNESTRDDTGAPPEAPALAAPTTPLLPGNGGGGPPLLSGSPAAPPSTQEPGGPPPLTEPGEGGAV